MSKSTKTPQPIHRQDTNPSDPNARSAELPPAPACPTWCTTHDSEYLTGWTVERGRGGAIIDATKICETEVGSVEPMDGPTVAVTLRRWAVAKGADVFVESPQIVVNDWPWLSREQAAQLRDVLSQALATTAEATGRESLCGCGKPAAHTAAPEDSAEWVCRVPAAIDARESARQDAYDSGYEDGVASVREGTDLRPTPARRLVGLRDVVEDTGIEGWIWQLFATLAGRGVGPATVKVASGRMWDLGSVGEYRASERWQQDERTVLNTVLDAFAEIREVWAS